MKKNHKASGGKADEFLPEPFVLCYGDEENARIYAVHLTTANQSEIRRARSMADAIAAGFSSLKEENFSWHRIKKSVTSGTIGETLYI